MKMFRMCGAALALVMGLMVVSCAAAGYKMLPELSVFDIGGSAENQWSFVQQYSMGLSLHNDWCSLLDKIPAIGVYYNDGYNFRTRRFVAQMKPTALTQAPVSLVNAVKTYVNANQEGPLNVVLGQAGVACDFYTVVTGMVENQQRDAQDRTYNLVNHGFLAVDYPGDVKTFQKNVAMGIFWGSGIEVAGSSPIAIDALGEQDVHFHDGAYCSPNDARFKVSAGRKLATFWSVAISPDKRRVAITYHLLVQDAALDANISGVLGNDDFDMVLVFLGSLSDILDSEEDKGTLTGFCTQLQLMAQ
jgi:hypothetical protein